MMHRVARSSRAVARALSEARPAAQAVRAAAVAQPWSSPAASAAAFRPNVSARQLHVSAVASEELVVNLPQLAESITEGEVGSLEVEVGDYVAMDQEVISIETDKLAVAVNAPQAGTIEEFFVEEGDTIGLNAPLFRMTLGGDAPAADAAPAAAAEPAAAATPAPAAAAPPPAAAAPPPAAAAAAAAPASGEPLEVPGVTRVKMTRARQTTARRLKESQETAAFLTTFNEIDMTNLMQMRKDNQEAFMKKHGVKLGFMSPFLKAVTHAAKKEPSVNAFIDGKDIVYHDFVNISVAVAAPKGLVVPVIRNCELKSFAEIEMSIGEMATKAREGTMAIEDMDGGTITVSNGGTFGSLMGTPIINPPQSAVLGMHGVFNRPVAIDGEVVIRPMMYVALTYDHRLIDGKEAVTFLRAVKEGVEDPLWMLMG